MSNPTKAALAATFNEAVLKAVEEGRPNSKVTEGLAAVIAAMPTPDVTVVARILQDINAGRPVLQPTQNWSKSDEDEQTYYLSRAQGMVDSMVQVEGAPDEPEVIPDPPDLDILFPA